MASASSDQAVRQSAREPDTPPRALHPGMPHRPTLPSPSQSASNSGYFEVVLRLVQHGSPWRLKGEADVVKLLSKKSSYK